MTTASKLNGICQCHGWIGTLIILLASTGRGQELPPPQTAGFTVPLEVTVRPEAAAAFWSVSEASLNGAFESVDLELSITNRSSGPFDGAHFYGRFYDDAGRLCFTAVFSQDVSYGEIAGPFLPGQTRVLNSIARVAPVVRPKKLELWFLDPSSSRRPNPEVAVPPTVDDGARAPGAPPVKETGQRVGSLALLGGTVDAHGRAASINVVASADPATAEWAARLVSSLRFEPAAMGDTPADSVTTLFLIRSLDLGLEGAITAAAPVWDDAWVQSYLETLAGRPELPVVQMLEVRRMSTAGAYEYFDVGTDWCSDVLRFVPNASGYGTHREWAAPLKPHPQEVTHTGHPYPPR